MKICSKCNSDKELSEFRKDKSVPGGYARWCRDCASTRHKELYKSKYHKKASVRNHIRHENIRSKLAEYVIDKACINCGEDDPVTFDFHHIDPSEKDFEIANSLNRKWDTILVELAKCVVLCANCHRKVHYGKLDINNSDMGDLEIPPPS